MLPSAICDVSNSASFLDFEPIKKYQRYLGKVDNLKNQIPKLKKITLECRDVLAHISTLGISRN